jgi:hypothetical protein
MPHYDLPGNGNHNAQRKALYANRATAVHGTFLQIHIGAMVLIYLGPNLAALPLDAAPGWYLALRRQPEGQHAS